VKSTKKGLEVGHRGLDLLAKLVGHFRVLPLSCLEGPLDGSMDLVSGLERLVESGLDVKLERRRLQAGSLQILSAHQRSRRTVFVPSKAGSGDVGDPLGVMTFSIRDTQRLGLVKVPLPLFKSDRTVPRPFFFE
jgi:hypothetical protein